MDFEKIKPAVEEIRLSEIQRERIIGACEKQKKKGFNYKLWIPVAAAVFVVVICSPGFIFRAGSKAADMAAPENGKGFYNYAADDEEYVAEIYLADGAVSAQSQSVTVEVKRLFNSGVYRKIYSVIPSQFAWLVDSEEYKNWEKTVNASGGMAMLQFVRHFNITREDFDAANEAYEAYINGMGENAIHGKPGKEEDESREIFNADIIYSFDSEKINGYYLADYN